MDNYINWYAQVDSILMTWYGRSFIDLCPEDRANGMFEQGLSPSEAAEEVATDAGLTDEFMDD